ncbi:acyl-CoA dehydrogenase family protein [Gordonia sp. SL306]|uniref:acyl-CoA dehydrogenase family protein n=1 Tax=Gordonia sp. SL306 TaxID=2995145 RepID=UPI00226F9419|nr:acyl-CoA dehydrogenase family protein [Gordonia sp. SL306]WAC57061.1 acyl-CoA dehydrogenase family protein [Gordonia sp. SL306]
MDFARVELADDDRAFQKRARAFLADTVTEEMLRAERATSDGVIVELHRAMGVDGWLEAEAKPAEAGGLTAVRKRIWDLERRRLGLPLERWGATLMILQAVRQYASPELLDEVLMRVFRGEVLFAMGYTEPEGGSDIATCKTRAVRDGDDWVINGQKMFTSGANVCQYVFLLTNTDPAGKRHRNLTMFLVPVETEGIEVQQLRTVDGDSTTITYYADVRMPDRYRLGDVDDGWAVLSGPLAAEHGATDRADVGLSDITTMSNFGMSMAISADLATAITARPGPDGRRAVDEESVAYRLGRAHSRIEAALATPSLFGRVAIAQSMRDVAPELMDILGGRAALQANAPGASAEGEEGPEYLFRWAPLLGIYGGTIDVFRNMIAQHILGLGRPTYVAPTK